MNNLSIKLCLGLALAVTPALWSQTENATPYLNDGVPTLTDDRMMTPPPVSGETFPSVGVADSRSNYLRGGLTFSSAYSDNVVGSINGTPTSDVSYSVWPTLALDQSTPRLHWVWNYNPGFTFYQKTSERNEADQNLGINLQYRLTQHVTLNFHDSFQKTSNVFNQADLLANNGVSGGPQTPVQSVIAPIADQLSNTGGGGITYQFSRSSMVGASGTFSNLHYPNQSQVPGLFDSATQGGSAFYNRRLSKNNYLGATYQYQRLSSYLTTGLNETQTHAVTLFYTVYITQRLSLSFSGGPQYALLPGQPPYPAGHSLSPMATGSIGWQGQHTSVAASYVHMISAGGGLVGAVHYDGGTLSLSRQLSRNLSIGAVGSYSDNKLLESFLPGTGGHTISGTASVRRQLGPHFNIAADYTRLHQNYAGIPLVSLAPDTNRESISISYSFTRPLGR